MSIHVPLLINGYEQTAQDGRTYDRTNPFTGKVVTTVSSAGLADASKAVDAAARAFSTWSMVGPRERRQLLLRAADIMVSKAPDFCELMTQETGATNGWGAFNVTFAASILRECAAMTTQIAGEIIPSDKPGMLSMAMRQAAGVCLAIARWNAPIILGTRAVAMAIACGNTVVLKSSEQCPGTHFLIAKCLVEAGLPEGVINIISNAPEDASILVEYLIAHPSIKRVNFTGSTKIGKVIAEICARHLKPSLLELGGKAPFIVLDDADVDGAVNAATFGAFANMGQICMSTERIIVHNDVAEEFVQKLSAKCRKLQAGDPRDNLVLGSMISIEAAERMEALIADATSKGAKIVSGGNRTGTIVEATLLDGVTKQMQIYSEESFGPVKPIIRVSSEEEAIIIANDTEYGLASAVFSRDIRRAMTVASRIEAGICHINGPTVFDEAQVPFGGMKGSGYGRFGGKAGIAEFTDLRWVTIEDPNQHYPF